MSEEREDALRGDRSGSSGAWKDFASSVLLVTAVGGILVAGFLLKTDRAADPGATESAGSPPPPATIVLGSTIIPEAAPPPAAQPVEPLPLAPESSDDPLFERLALRAARDIGRIEAAKGPWTAQILVACRTSTVDRLLTTSHGAAQLYVLPAEVHGDPCFRICWGSYGSAKEAASAADLPRSLRGKDKPAAVEIAKVLR